MYRFKILYRPIFTATKGSLNNLSEMLVSILDQISRSSFTVKYHASFVYETRDEKNRENHFMSYDIKDEKFRRCMK